MLRFIALVTAVLLTGCGLSAEEQERVNTRLFMALEEGSDADTGKALRDGADPNAFDEQGRPALLVALGSRQCENLIPRLLKAGADPNVGDRQAGETPLLEALELYPGRRVIPEILLQYKADVNLANKAGLTPLIRAARYSTALCKLFLDRGAKVNAMAKDGTTALINAAGSGSLETMELLLENGAEVNASGADGDTALLAAARAMSQSKIATLLDRGADIKAVDRHGNNALVYVILGGFQPTLSGMLIGRGADVTLVNKNGKSVLQIALDRGFWAIADQVRKAGGRDEKAEAEASTNRAATNAAAARDRDSP